MYEPTEREIDERIKNTFLQDVENENLLTDYITGKITIRDLTESLEFIKKHAEMNAATDLVDEHYQNGDGYADYEYTERLEEGAV